MTDKIKSGIMDGVSETPMPEFDETTGRLYLKGYGCSQVAFRMGEDGSLYILWRRTKPHREIPVTWEMLQECHKTMTGT